MHIHAIQPDIHRISVSGLGATEQVIAVPATYSKVMIVKSAIVARDVGDTADEDYIAGDDVAVTGSAIGAGGVEYLVGASAAATTIDMELAPAETLTLDFNDAAVPLAKHLHFNMAQKTGTWHVDVLFLQGSRC